MTHHNQPTFSQAPLWLLAILFGAFLSLFTWHSAFASSVVLPYNVQDGQLLQFKGNPTIYLVKPDGLYPFDTLSGLQQYQSQSGQKVTVLIGPKTPYTIRTQLAKTILNQAAGVSTTFPSGTLVNDGGTIYLIQEHTRSAFANYAAFTGLGYGQWPVVNGATSQYQLSATYLSSPGQSHPEGSLVIDGKTIWLISQGKRHGIPSMEVFTSSGYMLSRVLQANAADLALPEDSAVTPPSPAPTPPPSGAVPQAPTGLKVSTAVYYQATLAWSPVDNVTFYSVKRKTYNTPYVTIATTTTASYTDTTVLGNSYHYIITATNALGESASSTEVTAWVSSPGGGGTTSATPPPDTTAPVISSIATSSLTTTSAVVTWTTDESSDSRVDYGTDSSYGSATSSPIMTTSHSLILTGLATTTPYHFRVQSADASGNTARSSDQTIPIPAYYVDSVNGNDANTGLSAVQAVQTIARVTTLDATTPLDTWNLADGSVWHEELDVPRDNMTVESYGSGQKPLLDASDPIVAGAWSKTGGQTNVYQATLTIPSLIPSDPDWYTSVWENGTRYTIGHTNASVDSTASSYYPALVDSTTITLYVHTSDGSSPSTDGFLMEYSARLFGINGSGKTYLTLDGLRARRNIDANGSIDVGKHSRLLNLTAEEGNKHNILFDAGAYLNNVQAKGSYYENLGSSMFIGFGVADPTLGFTIVNSSAVNMGLSDNTLPGMYIHSSVLGATFGYVDVESFTGAIAMSACANVIVNNSTSTQGISPDDAVTVNISNTAITFDSSAGNGLNVKAATKQVTLTNVTMTGPSRSNSPGTTAINLGFAGVVLKVIGGTYQTSTHFINVVGVNSISVQGATIDVYHYGYTDFSGTPSFSVDYNTYVAPQSGELAYFGGALYNYTQWKATGQDAHSTP